MNFHLLFPKEFIILSKILRYAYLWYNYVNFRICTCQFIFKLTVFHFQFGRDIFKNGHNSQKQKSTPQRTKGSNNTSKNNCSMSPQEIELINWKRRKNYDPLKAVAEEKKKRAMALSAAGNGSGSNSPASSLSKKEASDCYDAKYVRVILGKRFFTSSTI